jgi:hypothetical protein
VGFEVGPAALCGVSERTSKEVEILFVTAPQGNRIKRAIDICPNGRKYIRIYF